MRYYIRRRLGKSSNVDQDLSKMYNYDNSIIHLYSQQHPMTSSQNLCYKNISLLHNIHQNQPILFMSTHNLYEEQLRSSICAIANSGHGLIYIVDQYNQLRLQKGITKFNTNNIKNLYSKLQSALATIQNNQLIRIKVQSVPLVDQQNKYKNYDKQYAIRIKIATQYQLQKNKKYKQLFYIQHKIKKQYKPIYIFPTLHRNFNNMYKIHRKEEENIYQYICDQFKQTNKIKCQQFMYQDKQIEMKVQKIGDMFNDQKYLISNQPNQFVFSLCKIMMSANFQCQIPNIKPTQSILLASINQRYQVIQRIRLLQNMFKSIKMKYTLIIPCYSLQIQLSKYSIQKNPNIATYLAVIFIYEGKYQQIKPHYQKIKNHKNLSEAVQLSTITQKINLAMILQTNQYDWYNQLIFQKYTILPLIKKTVYMEQNKKIYKNVQIKFDKIDKDAALYTYIFFQFIRKRPKCIS